MPLPPAGPAQNCPLAGSSNWAAWVNAMPGPGSAPTLIVTGTVTVPTGGWRFVWGEPTVMRSNPVQVILDLQPIAPTEGAIQVILDHPVRFQMPMAPPVGSVTVRCGSEILARIAPVETAH
jgi:hypothetical protein